MACPAGLSGGRARCERVRRLFRTISGSSSPRVSEVLFSIGEVSRRTGVSVDVIRAWERRYGLLEPQRSAAQAALASRGSRAGGSGTASMSAGAA